MTVPTDWTPGAISLGLAATIGVFVALRLWRKARPSGEVAAPSRASHLVRQRDALYEQIRALDGEPGWRPEDRALARHRLVIEAATTLQAMEQAASAPAPEPRPTVARSPWVSAVVGGTAGVFGAALVMGLQSYTKDGPATMGGGTMGGAAADQGEMSGDAPMTEAQKAQAAARIAAAKAAADAAPDDVHARLVYARALLDGGDVKLAYEQTQNIIKAHPDDADARTLQAVMLLQIGDIKMATDLLDKVISLHPDHVEALGYRGAVYLNAGDSANAIAVWQKVIALDPSQKENLDPLIQMAKEGKNPFAAPGGGQPQSAGPMSGGAPSGAESPPSPTDISGTITSSSPAPYLFVYLRPAGQDRGPPSAVKRFQNPTFPLDFRLGASDSPMGGAFPEDGTLSIRVDLDGNPTTHDEGAAETRVEHVHPGQSGVAVGL